MGYYEKIVKKHIKEAKAVDLTLIGAGKNARYRTYRFNKCKHEQEIRTGGVRNNCFRCEQCQLDKIQDEAKARGLTLIGAGRNAKYRNYRFNKCKHEQEIQTGNVRINNFRCGQCLQDKLIKEAKAVGLTLLRLGRNKKYKTYRFDKCGHEQEIQTGNVRNGKDNFICQQCLQIKIEDEAKAVGLTLIGAGRDYNYRTYRFNTCRHEQEIRTGGVRDNSFICNTCEETARDLPSKVYLLEITVDSFTWLKLGYAKTVRTRLSHYGLPQSKTAKRLKVVDFDKGRKAHLYEESLHKKYKSKRLPIKQMKEFHTANGFNECYPMKMKNKLLRELNGYGYGQLDFFNNECEGMCGI